MGLLARDGHVVMFKGQVSQSGPNIELVGIGRNQASTFTGLCPDHDNDLFRAIDTADLSNPDEEHLFLLAYRALLREQHVVMTGAIQILRAAKGHGPAAESLAAGWASNAFDLHEYRRQYFDDPLDARLFTAIEHDVLSIPTSSPTIAVSSLFSLDEVPRGGDVVRVALTVLPTSTTQSLAVLSYAPHDAEPARRVLSALLAAAPGERALELSRVILERTENFVLSPEFVDSWHEDKKTAIHAAMTGGILTTNRLARDPALMLFDE